MRANVYLVDTSAWLDYLKGIKSPVVTKLTEVLDRQIPFGITGVIYQEILQGAGTEEDFALLEEYFGTQRFYHPCDLVETYRSAAALYARCRRGGVTPRSTVDCFIAQVAIEHELQLIHSDRDFTAMARVIHELKIA
jgi:predicted nucleic acid-binding protein